MLILFDISALTGGDQNGVTLLVDNFVNAIHARKPFMEQTVIHNSTCEPAVSAVLNEMGDKTEPNFAAISARNHTQQISPARIVSNVKPVNEKPKSRLDSCLGRYIYMHDLPSQFNEDLIKSCHSLNKWIHVPVYIKLWSWS